MHIPAPDGEDMRYSSPAANLFGGSPVIGKMHMLPVHFLQTGFTYVVHKPRYGAMVKEFRRYGRGQVQRYIQGMALVGADHCFIFIKGKTLLIIFCHRSFQFLHGKMMSVRFALLQERAHVCPALGIKRELYSVRAMPENKAQ